MRRPQGGGRTDESPPGVGGAPAGAPPTPMGGLPARASSVIRALTVRVRPSWPLLVTRTATRRRPRRTSVRYVAARSVTRTARVRSGVTENRVLTAAEPVPRRSVPVARERVDGPTLIRIATERRFVTRTADRDTTGAFTRGGVGDAGGFGVAGGLGGAGVAGGCGAGDGTVTPACCRRTSREDAPTNTGRSPAGCTQAWRAASQ